MFNRKSICLQLLYRAILHRGTLFNHLIIGICDLLFHLLGLTQRVAKMDVEAKDYNAQQASVRDLERRYAEAVAQLSNLQNVHKQTVDSFEKEKMVFKVREFSNLK